MMSACLNGHGPTTSVRAYLSTSVRNIAAKRATGPKSAEVPSDDPTRYEDADRLEPDAVARRAELGLVREAFSSLPDRWQTVLWRTAVDHDSHDRVAEAMGLSRNGVAALAVRARRALKVAYLQAHVSRGDVDDDCRPFLDQLAALSQGSVPGRQLQDHLDGCRRCGERLHELALVEQNVAGFMLPAVAILIPATQDLTAAGGIFAASATAAGGPATVSGEPHTRAGASRLAAGSVGSLPPRHPAGPTPWARPGERARSAMRPSPRRSPSSWPARHSRSLVPTPARRPSNSLLIPRGPWPRPNPRRIRQPDLSQTPPSSPHRRLRSSPPQRLRSSSPSTTHPPVEQPPARAARRLDP